MEFFCHKWKQIVFHHLKTIREAPEPIFNYNNLFILGTDWAVIFLNYFTVQSGVYVFPVRQL